MNNIIRSGVSGVVALVLTGCATTQMKTTWKAPDAQTVSFHGQKVAAVVLLQGGGGSDRRVAEDALAGELTLRGVEGIPAYTLAAENDLKDKARAREIFVQKGIEGIVIMRPLEKKARFGDTPEMWNSAPYHSYWGGYHGTGWGGMYDPGYVTVKTVISVETLVYSLKQDKLIWAGVSETTDPEGIKSFVCELAKSATSSMQEDGVLIRANQ